MQPEDSSPQASADNSFYEALVNYRSHIVEAGQAMQSEYDKTVIALSGGALGVSFAFLKDIVSIKASQKFGILLTAWGFWTLSITAVLISFYTSIRSLAHARKMVDERMIYSPQVHDSKWLACTKILNAGSGLCFVIGLILFIIFVAFNPTPNKTDGSTSQTNFTTTSSPANPAAPSTR